MTKKKINETAETINKNSLVQKYKSGKTKDFSDNADQKGSERRKELRKYLNQICKV